MQSWDIESTNNLNSNLDILDHRRRETSLDDKSTTDTFEIIIDNYKNNYYQYLRIIQRGENTGNDYAFIIFHQLNFLAILKINKKH